MSRIIFMLGIVSLLIFLGFRIFLGIQFDRKCEGHIKRAADANSVALAKQELDQALNYIEKEGLTEGYTSVLYSTPDEDLAFWYQNLKSAQENLGKVDVEKISDLEESNLLIKLRETLVDHSGSSVDVTFPLGISIYPLNKLFCWWGYGSLLLICIGGIWWLREY